ncbi:MAG: TldD/PmbA family protein [Candidatus Heimdallarchaeaceae archaeon]
MVDSFEDLRNKILNVADSVIKHARDLGIPSAEAYVYSDNITSLSENKGKVDSRIGIVQGIGIRVADGKKIGFSTCTGFFEDSIKDALQKAHSIAKSSPENPLFEGFVAESKHGKDGILDSSLIDVTPSSLAEDVKTILHGIDTNDQRIIGVSIDLQSSWGGYAIGTTEGCLVSTITGIYGAFVHSVVMKEGDRKTASEFVYGRKVQDVSDLGTKAVEKALKNLGSKPFSGTEQLPTIWHPDTAAGFLSVPFLQALSGAAYVEKRNPLGDKLGKQILNDKFNLIDDGQRPEEPSTVAVDGEGSPVGKTEVIKDGVLKTFVYDRMYGKAAGVGTTANATRGGMMGGIPFETIPGVAPRKLFVEPVSKTLEEQIAECDKGIYIEEPPIGLFTANIITGDFSVTSNNAFLVENGEIVYPLKTVSIAGNYYKSFMDLEFIGEDLTRTQWPLDSPSITVKNHTISG